MIIKILAKNNFGNVVFYPHCPKSQLFAEIAGTKTLTLKNLKICKELGFNPEIIQPKIEVNL